MTKAHPIPIGTGIFNLGGTDFIILGFFGNEFAVAKAKQIDGFWYSSSEPMIPFAAEVVTGMIRHGQFCQVDVMSAAPSLSEIEAWYTNPRSLGRRHELIDAYMRKNHGSSPSRVAFLVQRERVERQIAEAISDRKSN